MVLEPGVRSRTPRGGWHAPIAVRSLPRGPEGRRRRGLAALPGRPAGHGPMNQPDGTADSAIQLVDVAKEYHSHGDVVTAVKRVDLTIAEGEFFSLLGPSGCGKTTTMRMI